MQYRTYCCTTIVLVISTVNLQEKKGEQYLITIHEFKTRVNICNRAEEIGI